MIHLEEPWKLDEGEQLIYHDGMAWAEREYTYDEIDQAGRTLISRHAKPLEIVRAIGIINNWRAAHAFPLNTMQVRLRDKARRVGGRPKAYVAQRVKRLPAIESKLRRLKNVSLVGMQDIGGCRAVVSTNARVGRLNNLYQGGWARHELEREVDYIQAPAADGYRGLHLIYRYHSDRTATYNGQRVEVQLRSGRQHAWATAVEAVDTFAGQQLKINMGSKEWTRFFALMGNCMAIRESTPRVPNTPESERELCDELRQLANDLNVRERLLAIGATASFMRSRGQDHYYLIDLDITERRLRITRYPKHETYEATRNLAELELEYRGKPDRDVLLVSVSSLVELRRMFPNYRADTSVFIRELETATAT